MLNYPIQGRALSVALFVALLGPTSARAQTDTSAVVAADSARPARHRTPPAADSAVAEDSVRTIARWLVANGAPERRARTVAAHVFEYARRRALDPLLVVGVIGVENASLTTSARSRAGARGVMQVMPLWKKDIRDCGSDMHEVRANICFGTAVLKIAMDASKSVREALLRYNGCVKSRGCAVYASAVLARVGNALIATRQPDSTAAMPAKRLVAEADGEVARER